MESYSAPLTFRDVSSQVDTRVDSNIKTKETNVVEVKGDSGFVAEDGASILQRSPEFQVKGRGILSFHKTSKLCLCTFHFHNTASSKFLAPSASLSFSGKQMSLATYCAHKWLHSLVHLMNRGRLGSSGWIFFRHWT
ncbi:hypothetical protein L2E82_06609 [Cichorium intybus]|uniref:Uncharacterized protein n=1 Tax=Cichorium intybus TaxID=13427 RepID=A0ACB9HBK5_CICIN|nr:hypothetical protein L2E82_06609 [Cichorium intybus]